MHAKGTYYCHLKHVLSLGACTCSLCAVCVQWVGGRGSGEGECWCGCGGGGWRGRGGRSPPDAGQEKTLLVLQNDHWVLEASSDDPECRYGIALAIRKRTREDKLHHNHYSEIIIIPCHMTQGLGHMMSHDPGIGSHDVTWPRHWVTWCHMTQGLGHMMSHDPGIGSHDATWPTLTQGLYLASRDSSEGVCLCSTAILSW